MLLGGHTVADQEIKFGYAVTGEIDPASMLTNARARAGDVLVLTKPLGTGIIATAGKFQRAPSVTGRGRRGVDAPAQPRGGACHPALGPGVVSACTDVTGFGLVGHASAMASASGVTLMFRTDALPLLEGALELSAANLPGGGRTNETHFLPRTSVASGGGRGPAPRGVRSPDVGRTAGGRRSRAVSMMRSRGSRQPGCRRPGSGTSKLRQTTSWCG